MIDEDVRRREANRLHEEFERLEKQIDQIEIDTLSWNDAHPNDWINPDVTLERKRLEELRAGLPPETDR